jgi:hypothetical protein
MRALLALDPTLARDLIGDRELAAILPFVSQHQPAHLPLR